MRNRIPFILKVNHNELLTYPNTYDQVLFFQCGTGPSTWARWGVGRDHLFRFRRKSHRQNRGNREPFSSGPMNWGMFTVLWCYLRKLRVQAGTRTTMHQPTSPGQANHLGVTLQADIIKQKTA